MVNKLLNNLLSTLLLLGINPGRTTECTDPIFPYLVGSGEADTLVTCLDYSSNLILAVGRSSDETFLGQTDEGPFALILNENAGVEYAKVVGTFTYSSSPFWE